MKKILLRLAACLFVVDALAQAITITSSPTVNAGKVDACNLPTSSALSALPLFTPVINASWDLKSTQLMATPITYTYKAKTPGFPTATFSDSLSNVLGSSSATIEYASWRNVKQSSTGVVILGEEVLKRQAKALGPTTGNNVDSIIFNPQAVVLNNELPIIKFPATMASKWSGAAIRILNFSLTLTSGGFNNSPGQHKQIHTTVDSVVGWGRMKVPIVGKVGSTFMEVLQAQHSDIYVDSFFLNNAPAPTSMLNLFGLSQGQSSTVARTYFYRLNAFRPLIEAVHSTPSHASSVSKVYIHADDLTEDETNIPYLRSIVNITLYPNPVRNGKLNINIQGTSLSRWNYTLVNINGQVITKGILPFTSLVHTCEIDLPKGIGTGLYYMKVAYSGVEIEVLPVIME